MHDTRLHDSTRRDLRGGSARDRSGRSADGRSAVAARLLIAAAAAALLLPASAGAQALTDVAASLRRDPVYVTPDAKPTLTPSEADSLRDEIRTGGAAPMFVAVLPGSAL